MTKRKPKISIISPCFNMHEYIAETIDSVLQQTCTDFEYIIVDGASTDGTLDIIKKYAKKDKRIVWLSEEDKGYHDAMLKGLAIAKGDYLMELMVSDGYINKKWLASCVDVFEKDPEVSLVWGFPRWLEQGKFTDVCYSHFHHGKVPQKQDWFTYWLATGEAVPNGNYCVRRKAFVACNPKRNETINGREFWDFNYAFNTKGYLTYNIPVVADWGRAHAGQLSEGWLKSGKVFDFMKHYYGKIAYYKKSLTTRSIVHHFRDGQGEIIGNYNPKYVPGKIKSYYLKGKVIFFMCLQRGPGKLKKIINKKFHLK